MHLFSRRTRDVLVATAVLLLVASGEAAGQAPACRNIDLAPGPERARPAATEPVLLHSTAPSSPHARRDSTRAGLIQVRFTVWCDGTVPLDGIQVVSVSDSALIEPVVAMLTARKYRPSISDSQPVARILEQGFRVGRKVP